MLLLFFFKSNYITLIICYISLDNKTTTLTCLNIKKEMLTTKIIDHKLSRFEEKAKVNYAR